MTPQPEPIAIIGSGCRFPGGASNPSKLWELLRDPQDCLSEIPKDRFNWEGFYHPKGPHHGSSNTKHTHFLSEDIRKFDPQFFNIQPGEADAIDPQQRLLLETVYEGLESAGLTIEGLQGSQTGVYVGMMGCDYADVVQRDVDSAPTYTGTGTARSIHSNRLSYFFDWHGPSMTIDTACSSSMMAIHLAVQALRAGDSRMAVACGASLIIGPENYVVLSNLNMIAPDGRAKMWDASANGYARGEGVASVVLKTLSSAIADGDYIECVIRETGINQDGRTRGITMPSGVAQAALIRSTYQRAGLDLSLKRDRPQYFEAHGTGTPVGDPNEAEAVHNSFFTSSVDSLTTDDIIYIGSIKTVIGHTEGAAGIAGLLKVSLALQNSTIPPNLLYNSLSPAVAPFAKFLRIPTQASPWPEVPLGSARRASVNSFGFGGSNGHAILESYDNNQHLAKSSGLDTLICTPFTFSAQSERTLASLLAKFLEYFKATDDINLRDVAYTLQHKRSAFTFKTSISALTTGDLVSKLVSKLNSIQEKEAASLGIKSSSKGDPRILGIFTGQGAQWARMGGELLRASSKAAEIIASLDHSLAQLPTTDRPSWTIADELLKDSKESRLSEAAISQPLCTAVQVLLVDMLESAGIRFKAVIGHSSGEIGAAYAAKFITASDAIRIAYYRGVHAKLSAGPDGAKGAMMAVGTSLDDARELCSLPEFKGRISIAACNSASSVTLSGDVHAIEEARLVFEEEKKFARILKLDTAYHSHHMEPCAGPYRDSLNQCGVQSAAPLPDAPKWYSSMRNGEAMGPSNDLNASYWVDNMTHAVVFSEALEAAISSSDSFDLVLEVGPHPSLKGPAIQTIQDLQEASLPYSGILSRGENDLEAFSNALGFVWAHGGAAVLNFQNYDQLFFRGPKASFAKTLPSYAWDHERSFWFESRIGKAHRNRKGPIHELIGSPYGDVTETEVKFRNFLIPKEIPWLNKHQLQGQAVFPAAAYAAMAWEGAKSLFPEESIKLIEIQDLIIGQAISFNDDNTAVETILTLTNIVHQHKIAKTFMADWSVHACLNKTSGSLVLVSTGKIVLTFGEVTADTLPSRAQSEPNLVDIDVDDFYSSLGELGYGYTGPFRAMTALQRKMNHSSGEFVAPSTEILLHPALLDMAFQALFAALSYPGDGALWDLHVPTSIRRIRVNPYHCSFHEGEVELSFDATLLETSTVSTLGNVSIYSQSGNAALLQVEGVSSKPFAKATMKNDRNIFSEMIWDIAHPNGNAAVAGHRATTDEIERGYLCERLAHFYLKNLCEVISDDERQQAQWHHKRLLAFASHIVQEVATGRHPYGTVQWTKDTNEDIAGIIERYPNDIDFKIMKSVGEGYPSVVRGQSNALEHLTEDNMLNDFYTKGLGFQVANTWAARTVKQISHRYPHMKVMEIGAGTGGATKTILDHLESDFLTYTYTDISTAFFEKAQERFKDVANKMIFKTFDMEKDIASQGYEEGSYDMVIASNVLHATKDLSGVLSNVRQLLKPGGYLILLEITDQRPSRMAFIMGGLSGWWLGDEEHRRWSPTVCPGQWNKLLQKSGFSGIDTINEPMDSLPYPFSVAVAQAVDDRISFLRDPIFSQGTEKELGDLLIIGGKTLESSNLINRVRRIIGRQVKEITIVDGLEDFNSLPGLAIPVMVLSLTELDEPMFKDMTGEKLKALKRVFGNARNIIWITTGCRGDEPYANMTVGLSRSLSCELHELRLQILDSSDPSKIDASLLSEMLLRLRVTDIWEKEGTLKDILWSTEPEMLLGSSNEPLIPRIYPCRSQNNRYNSKKRQITEEIAPQSSNVSITHSDRSYSLQADNSRMFRAQPTTGIVSIQVTYSILTAIKVGSSGFLFLSFGQAVDTEEAIIALSRTNTSIISVPSDHTFRVSVQPGRQKKFLLHVASELLAHFIASSISPGGRILVRGAPESLFTAISRQALGKGRNASQLTTDPITKDSSSIMVHPLMFENNLKALLPSDISVFLDLSDDIYEDDLHSRVSAILAPSCQRITTEQVLSQQISEEPFIATSQNHIEDILEAACSHAQVLATNNSPVFDAFTIPLNDIPQYEASSFLSVVDWAVDPVVSINVKPIETKIAFDPDKTYLLIGLTADLGQSLCEWFVYHGARHIALTSRNPKIEKKWLKNLEDAGAVIKVMSMDITDKRSLHSAYNEICRTLPPIAGVAHAAMVLQDIMFTNMEIENLLPVLDPKVKGSIYLDELFSDNTLDFFILFSSLGLIVGNSGQSSYTAANGFMASLAAQRRKRGLAASVMDIGAIIGAGYITRAGQIKPADLNAYGAYPLSVSDFQQMFGEAVLASPPNSGLNPEIITGIRKIDPVVDDRVSWRANPKFSHFWLDEEDKTNEKDGRKATVSAKTQLLKVTSKDEAKAVVQACFSARLIVLLQLPIEDMDDQVPLIELGVDSLVAVEARGWFTKELSTDVPVLRILGGASVIDLVNDAVEKLTPDQMPCISSDVEKAALKATPVIPSEELPSSNASEIDFSPGSPESHESQSDNLGGDSSITSDSDKDEAGEGVLGESFVPKIIKTYQMSYAQSRFWFLKHSLQDATAFNITFSHHLKGNAHPTELAAAVRKATELHEGLRTCFFERDNRPVQGILESSPLHMERKKIRSEAEAKIEFAKLDKHEYDLENGRAMRILFLELSPLSSYLIVGYHHIAMDGAGFTGLLQELLRIGGGELLAPPALQYGDYSDKERKEVESGTLKDEMAYWRRQFADIPPVLPLLPFAKVQVRSTLRSYAFSSTSFRIDSTLAARIKRRVRNFQSTSFHFYLAVLKTLLFRFLDTEDISIGIAESNRGTPEMLRTMGLLVNLLPLRFKSQLSQTFGDAVKEARKTAYSAMANSKLPFNAILEGLNVERSASSFPIFQVFMDYRPGIQEKLTLGDTEVQRMEWSYGKNPYDLNLDIMENSTGDAFVTINAQEYLYGQREVDILGNVYLNLLEAFSRNPALRLNEPALFSDADISQALILGRGLDLPSDWPSTLSQRVDDISVTHEGIIALKDGDGSSLTYREMTSEVNKIANALLVAGVNQGDKVALFQQPTTIGICSLLAILRVGCVYVPLDLRSPMPRLITIVEDCKPRIILSHKATSKYASPLIADQTRLLNVSALPAADSSPVPNCARAADPAVILYTSGSTGNPKGVLLRHSGIRNIIEFMTKQFQIGAETILQQSALTFDLSLNQIFMALANGGTLFIVPQSKRGDAGEITNTIVKERVTYTLVTPSEYSYWLRFGTDKLKEATWWKWAFSCGEELKPRVREEFKALGRTDLHLINTYGPAEITIQCHAAEIPYSEVQEESHDVIPAGYTMPNCALYIMDNQMRPLPVGIPGEICIGGAGVALGYVNIDDATAEKFLPDPHAPLNWKAKDWDRLYRTGDKGRLRSDGTLQFEGRMAGGTQIKLRGIRIELGEIENTLVRMANGALDEVVVSVRGDPEFLTAHAVFSRDSDIADREALLKQLLVNLPLPQYMHPAMIIILDRIPLTSHNKADRKAISAMALPKEISSMETVRSLGPLETDLIRIWEVVLSEDLLNSRPVDSNTGFFQVGGSSLLLIPLQSLIKETYNVVLAMVDFADANTLGKMAARIEMTATTEPIDWKVEAAIPDNLTLPAIANLLPLRAGHDLRVLYTGATGHSARFILKQLVSNDNISKIYCVGVRQVKGDPNPRTTPVQSDKIVLFPGDLSEPRLGLSEEQTNFLAGEVDVILHSASNRSLWDNYQVLRRPNVLATQFLISLAVPRRIPIHFMSSHAVHVFSGKREEDYPEAMAIDPPPQDGSDGYVASKFAVEKLLENAAERFKLPVYFHRPASVGPSPTVTTEEVFAEFLRCVRILKKHVLRDSIHGYIDLILLVDLARKLDDHLMSSTTTKEAALPGVRYIHHRSDVRVQMGEWKAYMDKHNEDLTLDMVEEEHAVEWVGQAKLIGFPYMLAAQDFDMSGVKSALPIIQRR